MSTQFLEPIAPGPERIRRFREDGFFATAPILSADECAEVIAEYDRMGRVIPVGDAARGSIAYQAMLHLASPLLERYAADRRFAEIVMPLIGP
ncbi:MAG TPA: hypothetical protein VMT58_09215, partial [Candidatus Binataceae bacterium]|nr:hypothetical protein [Candidatus Binataceae bacterium]